jgi:hypothetical protein
MDTALHAAAVPDADASSLQRPEIAARELVELIAGALPRAGVSHGVGTLVERSEEP